MQCFFLFALVVFDPGEELFSRLIRSVFCPLAGEVVVVADSQSNLAEFIRIRPRFRVILVNQQLNGADVLRTIVAHFSLSVPVEGVDLHADQDGLGHRTRNQIALVEIGQHVDAIARLDDVGDSNVTRCQVNHAVAFGNDFVTALGQFDRHHRLAGIKGGLSKFAQHGFDVAGCPDRFFAFRPLFQPYLLGSDFFCFIDVDGGNEDFDRLTAVLVLRLHPLAHADRGNGAANTCDEQKK